MLDAEFYRRQCARLREESEELLETVRQLRIERDAYAQLCDTPMRRAMETLNLSPFAAKLLCRLIESSPKAIVTECLMAHLGGVSLPSIKVYVSRIRSALRSMGCQARIWNVYGTGYYMGEADAQEVRILLELPQTEKSEDSVNQLAIIAVPDSVLEKQRAVG
jgi:DNA-binding response OmpR family regulator